MEFYTLASGSSGNCSLVCAGDTLLLIDAGISCRRIEQSLRALGRTLGDLTAVFITHEHADHVGGLATLSKKSAAPVYVTRGVSHILTCPVVAFTAGDTLEFAGCTVRSFSTSHDAVDPVGYRIDAPDGSLGILTDTGFVTDAARESLPGVDMLLLEANHDVETLQYGPYPQAPHPRRRRAPVQRRGGGICTARRSERHARHPARAPFQGEQHARAGGVRRRPRAAVRGTFRAARRRAARHHERGTSMQKVTVLCVGKLKEAFYAAAVAEYQKRLQRHCKLEIVELPEQKLPESPAPAEIEQALAREAALIEEKLPKGGAVIALCIEGTELSSEALSKKLAQLASAGASQLAFLIGGSFGLHPRVKQRADLRLSMSPMTFPHHLARVMLLEQLYRAYQIDAGTRYHK